MGGMAAPIKLFDIVGEPETLNQRWTLWKSDFDIYIVAAEVKDPKVAHARMLLFGGPGLREIYNNFTDAEKTVGADTDIFKVASGLFDGYFKLKTCVPKARQNFLDLKPEPGETVNNYITRLKAVVKHCDYKEDTGNQVRDRILWYIRDPGLKSKLYREADLTLEALTKVISEYHDKAALVLIPLPGGAPQVNLLRGGGHSSRGSPTRGSAARGGRSDKSDKTFSGNCWRCGDKGHMGRNCQKSRNHVCGNCGFKGHFESCCRTVVDGSADNQQHNQQSHGQTRGRGRGRGQSRGRGRGGSHNVRNVNDCDNSGEQVENDDFYVFSAREEKKSNTLTLFIDDALVDVIIDSGANCNLISEDVLNSVCSRKPRSNCAKKVYPYGSDAPLKLIGKTECVVYVPETGKTEHIDFYIVPGNHPTLIGHTVSEKLGILRIGVNNCNVKPPSDDQKEELRRKYPKIFQGLGKLKGYQLKLHIDESVYPVAQPVRRIPFSRRKRLMNKLDELEKLGVIEKVNGPTSWVNPLVVVEKESGDVRVCLDMRRANQAIVREKHPVPTVEETLQEISGAKVFSKLDLNMAYHQVELHPDSRDITTFAAPDGLYRYKRLIFGVNMATEKFQHIIWQVIKGCPGVHNLHDDIRVVGKTQEDHDVNLYRVVCKLQESGLTLNYSKCVIGVDKMIYMGDVLSGDGLTVSTDRVRAIVDAPRPKDKSEVRSFLGSAQFCAKFISGFATITSPLWNLTRSDTEWKWSDKEEEAFRGIKRSLTQAPVMAYYKHGAKTRLTTDASPVGLGAILEQEQDDGTYRPVYYASRKLSNVESRYSQFEREALGVRWACHKFQLYLLGIDYFEICTDHKPLVTVLGHKSTPPSARIEKWLLYLQQFRYEIRHIKGKDNSADALSRLPIDGDIDRGDGAEDFAYSVVVEAVPAAMSPQSVEVASEQDPTLQLVRAAVKTGDWVKLQGTMYKAIKDELWMLGQLVMRGNRIVMPETLWKKTLQLAHEGHQGMVRTKARLREKVWWPQMDKEVEKLIHSCHPCQLVGRRSKPEPIRSTTLPVGPWSDLAVDLCEIPGGNHLLVVIDYYSRWPEVVNLRKTDAAHVKKSMEAMFNTHGLPDSVRSDNGPPFASAEFEGFLGYLGIQHKKGVPYWPQSNGEVERANATILKCIRIAQLEGRDWRKALSDFLFVYRTTPHTVTGVSPAELLMGRKLRDKLPKVIIPDDRLTESDWQIHLRERDAKAKLRQKEYADKERSATPSNINEGDKVLLQQSRINKLSPTYEPEPYVVVHKDGNATIIQSPVGNTKMRNTAHLRRFVEPESTQVQPIEASDTDEVQPTVDIQPTIPDKPNVTAIARPSRERHKPSWMGDFVC